MTNKAYIRVPVTMTEKMVNFMETISLKSKVTGGHKLPNTAIVRACLRVLMDLNVDVSGVKDEEELKGRIMEAKAKYTPKAPKGKKAK